MASPGSGETGPRRPWRLLRVVLAGLGALLWAAPGIAQDPTIEPAEGPGGFEWAPSTASVLQGGAVAFRNPSKIVPHGLAWTQGPSNPNCIGVPVDGSSTEWSGSCTFAESGTYDFVCTVHPWEMKGKVGVGSGVATPPGEQAPEESERAFTSLRLAKSQRGRMVRGSLVVSQSAVGGKLTLVLRARRSALGGAGQGAVRVGQLTQRQSQTGRHPFAVPLNAAARQALRERGNLSVTVKIDLAPPSEPRATATRRVELHG